MRADERLQKLMEDRYGEHERPDGVVEVIDYANDMNQEITLEWLDKEMAKDGIYPKKENRGGGPGKAT
jgi:hypothetical protein